jgi:hypothetical protein
MHIGQHSSQSCVCRTYTQHYAHKHYSAVSARTTQYNGELRVLSTYNAEGSIRPQHASAYILPASVTMV